MSSSVFSSNVCKCLCLHGLNDHALSSLNVENHAHKQRVKINSNNMCWGYHSRLSVFVAVSLYFAIIYWHVEDCLSPAVFMKYRVFYSTSPATCICLGYSRKNKVIFKCFMIKKTYLVSSLLLLEVTLFSLFFSLDQWSFSQRCVVIQEILKTPHSALYCRGIVVILNSVPPLYFCEEVIVECWCGNNFLCRGGTFVVLN